MEETKPATFVSDFWPPVFRGIHFCLSTSRLLYFVMAAICYRSYNYLIICLIFKALSLQWKPRRAENESVLSPQTHNSARQEAAAQ